MAERTYTYGRSVQVDISPQQNWLFRDYDNTQTRSTATRIFKTKRNSQTCNEVGLLAVHVKLLAKEIFGQRHERKDGAVVGQAGEAEEPEGEGEGLHVRDLDNLSRVPGLADIQQLIPSPVHPGQQYAKTVSENVAKCPNSLMSSFKRS
jgi:hypothetical protein